MEKLKGVGCPGEFILCIAAISIERATVNLTFSSRYSSACFNIVLARESDFSPVKQPTKFPYLSTRVSDTSFSFRNLRISDDSIIFEYAVIESVVSTGRYFFP